jgi:hypothetical protein
MYTERNFKTKKELKLAVEARLQNKPGSYPVTYYQPGPFGGKWQKDGTIYIEGPHYPKPHMWYAQCVAEKGEIVKVK